MIEQWGDKLANIADVRAYREEAARKSDFERTELNKDKTGVKLAGVAAINPVNGKEIPIFVSDYVLMGYGTGAIMAVPAHDDRDWEFAKKFGCEIIEVVSGGEDVQKAAFTAKDETGILVNSDFLRGARLGPALAVGPKVVVLGGGNVALDCARTAFRLGAEQVAVACLESREAMTASLEELEEAIQEGVKIHNRVTFLSVEGEDHVTGVQVQEVAGFHFDENHRAVINR